MDITLQYFDGCPNWETIDSDLAILLEEEVIDATVHHQLIGTPEAAAEHGFRGSPTVLIDGTDPFADPDAPVGLSCRIYLTEDGPAGSPILDQLRQPISAPRTGA